MENLQIQLNDKLSINDLVALKGQGFSVLRSAHVGNLSPYNLTVADAGIPLLLVDHNVTGVDKANAPEFSLTQQGETRLALDGLISSRARVSDGRFLDEFHSDSVRVALPDANIFTNTEYVRKNRDVVGEIAYIAMKSFPKLFERVVQPGGNTLKMSDAASLINTIGILQLNDDPRLEKASVLMPNLVNIMANFVVEMLLSERDVQFHVAGSKMVGALKGFGGELQGFYRLIKQSASFNDQLPETLTVNIVPGAHAIFATSNKFASDLASVFAQLDESDAALASLSARRGSVFTGRKLTVEERKNYAADFDQQRWAIERRVIDCIRAVPGLLDAPEDRTTVTQYDVMSDGGLFVAQQNRDMTFSELAGMKKRLVALEKRAA